MTCKQVLLYQSGELSAQEIVAFKAHLATCKSCQAKLALAHATEQSLAAPAAPADLVERVLLKTTRRTSAWKRFRAVWAGGVAAIAIAVGVGIHMWQPAAFNNAELVAYMSQSNPDEYATFLSDLDLFEQTF